VNGQQLKCLTVADEFTKEGLAIEVDGRIRSARVGGPARCSQWSP
jgi:putative transposase